MTYYIFALGTEADNKIHDVIYLYSSFETILCPKVCLPLALASPSNSTVPAKILAGIPINDIPQSSLFFLNNKYVKGENLDQWGGWFLVCGVMKSYLGQHIAPIKWTNYYWLYIRAPVKLPVLNLEKSIWQN